MSKLSQLMDWKKKYGIINVVSRGFHMLSPIQSIANSERIRRVNWQAKCKKQLKKYLVIQKDSEAAADTGYTRTIWWMWLQGAEQAPPLVKACLKSVQAYAESIGFQVIELNERNLFDYVQLPDFIIEKWKSGQIIPAQFSDLCRINLMTHKGGMWIDSTVLLTGRIEEEIIESDLFFYRASFLDESETKISNWFLYAKAPGNPFYCSLNQSLLNWWEHKRYPNDYFFFHLIAALLIESGQFQEMLQAMPYYSNTYPTLLQHELKHPFDEKRFRSITAKTSVHKLTYKGLDMAAKDTFLSYLLNQDTTGEPN